MARNEDKHPRGYWVSIGMSFGMMFGLAIGITIDNLAIGIGIGMAIGAGIGAALEQKNKDQIRPIMEREQKMQRWGLALGVLMLLLLTGIFILLLFLRGG